MPQPKVKITLFHNPRCSKSRCALDLLKNSQFEFTVVEYLKNPPSRAALDSICKKLKVEPEVIVRKKENGYKALGLGSNPQLSRRQWLDLLAENPQLIERPIALCGNKAAIGRPLENIAQLLEDAASEAKSPN